jgi:integrase
MNPTNFNELLTEYQKSNQHKILGEGTRINYESLSKKLLATGSSNNLSYTNNQEEARGLSSFWWDNISAMNYSNSQINELKKHINRIYNWGIKNIGLSYDSNPANYMPTLNHELKETHPFTREEIESVKDMKGSTTKNEEWLSNIIVFLFETGMRPNEMMELKLSDVVLDDTDKSTMGSSRLIQIIGAKGREKGKVSRYVAVTPAVQECIKSAMEHRRSVRCSNEQLFCSIRGFKILGPLLNRSFRDLMVTLRMPEKEIRDLRRGCATSIIHDPRYGINVAMKQLGHKNIATTMIYESLNKKRAAGLFKGH